MEQTYQPTSTDLFDQQQAPKGLPGTLNVLTILTFIGCGLSYIGLIISLFTNSQENVDKQREQIEQLEDSSPKIAEAMQQTIDIAQKNYDNRYILLASGLLFTTMCLIGALQMRKLKKSGYMLYIIGEIAPIIISAVLIGFSLVGGIMTTFMAVVALVFVILYTTQRKHLVNP
ncbi:MAG: hypothetical protein JWP69_1992 [Flaviaesturariibacter sp.]|nr:hypothetical protein [Flaviaesturariibacter sp.]